MGWFVFFKTSHQAVREVLMLKQLWWLILELMKGRLEIFTFPQSVCSTSNHGLSNKFALFHFETYSNLLDMKLIWLVTLLSISIFEFNTGLKSPPIISVVSVWSESEMKMVWKRTLQPRHGVPIQLPIDVQLINSDDHLRASLDKKFSDREHNLASIQVFSLPALNVQICTCCWLNSRDSRRAFEIVCGEFPAGPGVRRNWINC